MKKKKGSTYIFGWVSKGNASSLTMPQPLGYEVDTGECMDIATMGSTTIKTDQVANQWGYYTGGERSSSSSSKGKKQVAAAPTSQQQQLIQQQQPKRQQPTPAGKQTRHYTPQIAAAAASAARQRGEGMDVDECTNEDENFEDDPAEAMDEDDPPVCQGLLGYCHGNTPQNTCFTLGNRFLGNTPAVTHRVTRQAVQVTGSWGTRPRLRTG